MHTINLLLIFHTLLFLYNGIILLHVLLLLLINISACANHGQQLLKKVRLILVCMLVFFFIYYGCHGTCSVIKMESFILTNFYMLLASYKMKLIANTIIIL